MIVPVSMENEVKWAELCVALWPEASVRDMLQQRSESRLPYEYLYYIGDEPVAFLSLSLRNDYVEGSSSSPTGYIEGIYVKPDFRRKDVARKLVDYAKEWSKGHGCLELASDCELGNNESRLFHNKIGFNEENRIICFVMKL